MALRTRNSQWQPRHATITPFGAAIATWVLSALVGDGPWLFWHNMEPVKSMAGVGTIGYGMVAVLGEGGIKLVFWAIDERRKKLTAREIDTLTTVRERLEREEDVVGLAVVDEMIEDRRRNPLRIGVRCRRRG